jgi:hypothetical protein
MQSRKLLKNYSIIVLLLAGLTALNLAFEIFFGEINNAAIPEGSPENILLITKIFIAVLTVLMLLPQIYIGFKGIKMSKTPDSSKAHIVWGVILFVFTLSSLLTPLLAAIRGEEIFANIAEFCSIVVDATILFGYVTYAIRVLKGN